MADTRTNRGRFGPRSPGQHESRIDGPGSCVGYLVCDPRGRKIGSVIELFFNDFDEPEYVNVKMGLFGSKTVLIPVTSILVKEEQRILMLQ